MNRLSFQILLGVLSTLCTWASPSLAFSVESEGHLINQGHKQIASVYRNQKTVKNVPLAPCETVELRVAAASDIGPVFREGVGTVFTDAQSQKKYILTVAHVVKAAQSLIGFCNGQFIDVKPLGLDTSLDIAVLEIVGSSNVPIEPLFIYQKGRSPQILVLEKASDQSLSDLSYSHLMAIETLQPDFKSSLYQFYRRAFKGGNSSDEVLSRYDRRSSISLTPADIIAEKTGLLPGSDWIYALKNYGVKPGMSGSPVFLTSRFNSRGEDPRGVVMVGLVSKTKINATESALVPFNKIYERLDDLLAGQANFNLELTNETLNVFGNIYRNLGAGQYSNVTDEVPLLPLIKNGKDQSKSDKKNEVDFNLLKTDLLKNKDLLKDKEFLKKNFSGSQDMRSGVDWGDGNGDLLKQDAHQFLYIPKDARFSFYYDSRPHSVSGIQDQQDRRYYGIHNDKKFEIIKSVHSVSRYSRYDLDYLLKTRGESDPQRAFSQLCLQPQWQRSGRLHQLMYRAYGENEIDSRASSFRSPEKNKIDVFCKESVISLYSRYPSVQMSLSIDSSTVKGEMQVLGCPVKINVTSDNLWERTINNEAFEGKIEIGDGEEFLVKVTFFKIKKSCQSNLDSNGWTTNNLLSTVVIQ